MLLQYLYQVLSTGHLPSILHCPWLVRQTSHLERLNRKSLLIRARKTVLIKRDLRRPVFGNRLNIASKQGNVLLVHLIVLDQRVVDVRHENKSLDNVLQSVYLWLEDGEGHLCVFKNRWAFFIDFFDFFCTGFSFSLKSFEFIFKFLSDLIFELDFVSKIAYVGFYLIMHGRLYFMQNRVKVSVYLLRDFLLKNWFVVSLYLLLYLILNVAIMRLQHIFFINFWLFLFSRNVWRRGFWLIFTSRLNPFKSLFVDFILQILFNQLRKPYIKSLRMSFQRLHKFFDNWLWFGLLSFKSLWERNIYHIYLLCNAMLHFQRIFYKGFVFLWTWFWVKSLVFFYLKLFYDWVGNGFFLHNRGFSSVFGHLGHLGHFALSFMGFGLFA